MEQVREITECCICMETYTDPRILSCIHNFCLKCLEQTAAKSEVKPGDSMPCPICRKPFVVPTEGMASLQKNFFIQRLVEVLKLPNPSSDDMKCGLCKTVADEEKREILPAIQFCIQCHQNICNQCLRDHKKFKELQHHQLVQIRRPMKDDLIKKSPLPNCHLHGKEESKLYCVDCGEFICKTCFDQKHKPHNCSDIDEIGEEFRKRIKRDSERMSGYAKETMSSLRHIDTLQKTFENEVENVEKKIFQKAMELKEIVDKYTRSLLNELALIKQRATKRSKLMREESEIHKTIIQSFETYCMELSSKGSSAEICGAANDVHLRADKLEKDHQKHILRAEGISKIEVTFESSSAEMYLMAKNVVGSIRAVMVEASNCRQREKSQQQSTATKDNQSAKNDETLWTTKPRLIGEITTNASEDKGKGISGIAIIGKELYVSHSKTPRVRIYDSEALTLTRVITVDSLVSAWDLAYCKTNSCLYIMDAKEDKYQMKNIMQLNLNGVKLRSWSTQRACGCISVAFDSNIVFTSDNENRMVEYTPTGDVVREIQLSKDDGFGDPRHAVKLQNGDFLVSFGANSFSQGLHRVCVIDTWANVKMAFGSKRGFNYESFRVPIYMTINSKGSIIIIDRENSRLMLLDSDFKFNRELIPREMLRMHRPERMAFDESTGRLFLGHDFGFSEKNLLVFKMD